jgi:hypothetical protein
LFCSIFLLDGPDDPVFAKRDLPPDCWMALPASDILSSVD